MLGRWLAGPLRPVLFGAARLWRRALPRTTFIAVTGALGKTTSKECLAAVLTQDGGTVQSYRNQNGGYLVPLSVLRARPWHRYAVLEVGSGAPGWMEPVARVVRPDVVVVTNVLRTHTTAFADLDAHAREKEVLLRHMAADGIVALNADDGRVAAMARRVRGRVVTFGTSPGVDVRAEDVVAQWPGRLRFVAATGGGERCEVHTQLVGVHWVSAVLGALAVAHALGVPLARAAAALATVPPFTGRLSPVDLPSGAVLLRDDYNASIDTAEAAFAVMTAARAARRVVVLSDLSDLAGHTPRRRRLVARAVAGVADVLVVVGESAAYGCRRAVSAGMAPDAVHACADLEEAAALLGDVQRPGDLILLKGRTTDHMARVFFAQLGEVRCWRRECRKTCLCDECWELGFTPAGRARATRDAPPS